MAALRDYSPGKHPGAGLQGAAGPVSATAPEPAESEFGTLDAERFREELLDPAAWCEILSQFGRTMRLAVALTDADGSLLGLCHNVQPVWSLVRERTLRENTGPAAHGCPFCLSAQPACAAVSIALDSREMVVVHDRAGLAHVAIGLFLGNRRLGALIAGQCFTHYPQPLAIQRVAADFGVAPQELWSVAVHQAPVGIGTLRLYGELLESLGRAFLRQRFSVILNRKLREIDQRYRFVVEGMNDYALYTVGPTGQVTSWNAGAERLLGYSESEIVGQNCSRFFTPEDLRDGVNTRLIELAERDGWTETEGWQTRRDGTRFLSVTVTARMGEEGSREYGKLLHDVTTERKTAESVMQAQKLESIGVLAGGIAHDFNNLLTGILGNVSLALLGLDVHDPTRPLLEKAEQSSVKAAALVTQLLSYAGKGIIAVSRFDLSKLVGELAPLLDSSIPRTVRLVVSPNSKLPWIEADVSALQQIVMNLIINAAESIGPEGGTVNVALGTSPVHAGGVDDVYMEVRDTGCGMDEATKQRIFDPFFTTKATGRGLGLSAVSGLVRRLNGKMEVKSAPGEGTRFRVSFPGVPAEVQAEKVAPRSVAGGTGTILVVDDDAPIRNLVRAILERYGYSVLVAENGQEGLDVFRDHADHIAAVLLDLTMPVMGGAEAFKHMTRIRPDIPIIVSTGFGETGVEGQFVGCLAGIIQKPYSASELAEKVGAVLAGTVRTGSHAARTSR
jgi:PAS domain S-box-containing protein